MGGSKSTFHPRTMIFRVNTRSSVTKDGGGAVWIGPKWQHPKGGSCKVTFQPSTTNGSGDYSAKLVQPSAIQPSGTAGLNRFFCRDRDHLQFPTNQWSARRGVTKRCIHAQRCAGRARCIDNLFRVHLYCCKYSDFQPKSIKTISGCDISTRNKALGASSGERHLRFDLSECPNALKQRSGIAGPPCIGCRIDVDSSTAGGQTISCAQQSKGLSRGLRLA